MNGFLKIASDYTCWNVYRKSVIICDVTEMFINRALPHGSRTIDQMRQAARSCKQNIVEGVSDATVSAEMCIKLLGVARGSVRELLEDYGDFLRQHDLEIWDKMINAQWRLEHIASAMMMRKSLLPNVVSAAMKRWPTLCLRRYGKLTLCLPAL